MKLVTRQDLANTVAERWKVQYFSVSRGWQITSSGCSEETYRRLVLLGPRPSFSEVNEVMGNTSWTSLGCYICEKNTEEVGQVDIGSGGRLLRICRECSEKVSQLFA